MDRIVDIAIEALANRFLQSYFLVAHLLFPIHAWTLLAHKLADHFMAMLGHSGHEYAEGRLYRLPSPLLTVRFHGQHHQHFKWNFGTTFCWWDWWMGLLHPDYIASTRRNDRQG